MTKTELITQLISDSGMGTDEIGHLTGVSRRTVQRWQSGDALPRKAHLVALGAFNGLSLKGKRKLMEMIR